MSTITIDRPIRVGIFDTVAEADSAVARLLQAGFSVEQITVVCSQQSVQKHFHEFEHQDPAGSNTTAAAATGTVIGAMLGGLVAVAGAMTGGIALLAAGGLALWSGGVVGGLVGAMMTRGVEKELANYYNQAVISGKILVAAEQHDAHGQPTLKDAEAILTGEGSNPLPLVEG